MKTFLIILLSLITFISFGQSIEEKAKTESYKHDYETYFAIKEDSSFHIFYKDNYGEISKEASFSIKSYISKIELDASEEVSKTIKEINEQIKQLEKELNKELNNKEEISKEDSEEDDKLDNAEIIIIIFLGVLVMFVFVLLISLFFD